MVQPTHHHVDAVIAETITSVANVVQSEAGRRKEFANADNVTLGGQECVQAPQKRDEAQYMASLIHKRALVCLSLTLRVLSCGMKPR